MSHTLLVSRTASLVSSRAPATPMRGDTANDAPGGVEGFSLALVHHCLARMYQAAGEGAEAAAQYRRCLSLWDEAAAAHRPLLTHTTQRIAELQAGGTPGAGIAEEEA